MVDDKTTHLVDIHPTKKGGVNQTIAGNLHHPPNLPLIDPASLTQQNALPRPTLSEPINTCQRALVYQTDRQASSQTETGKQDRCPIARKKSRWSGIHSEGLTRAWACHVSCANYPGPVQSCPVAADNKLVHDNRVGTRNMALSLVLDGLGWSRQVGNQAAAAAVGN